MVTHNLGDIDFAIIAIPGGGENVKLECDTSWNKVFLRFEKMKEFIKWKNIFIALIDLTSHQFHFDRLRSYRAYYHYETAGNYAHNDNAHQHHAYFYNSNFNLANANGAD